MYLKITLHSAAAEEIIKNYIAFLDPGGITIGDKIITYRFLCVGELIFGNLGSLTGKPIQHVIPGGINYCNVTIGAVLSWKPRMIRLQLQFFLFGSHWGNYLL